MPVDETTTPECGSNLRTIDCILWCGPLCRTAMSSKRPDSASSRRRQFLSGGAVFFFIPENIFSLGLPLALPEVSGMQQPGHLQNIFLGVARVQVHLKGNPVLCYHNESLQTAIGGALDYVSSYL